MIKSQRLCVIVFIAGKSWVAIETMTLWILAAGRIAIVKQTMPPEQSVKKHMTVLTKTWAGDR